jgi:hypothetical protein
MVRNRFLSLLSCIQKCPCAVSIKSQFLNKSGGMCRALSSARRTQGSTRVTTKDQTKGRSMDRLIIRVVLYQSIIVRGRRAEGAVAAAAAREELEQLNPDILDKASVASALPVSPGRRVRARGTRRARRGARARGGGVGGGYLVGFRVYSSAFGAVERIVRLGRVIYDIGSILDRSGNRAPDGMFSFARSASLTLQ